MNEDIRDRVELLVEYLEALAKVKGSDGSIIAWANTRAVAVCNEIEKLLEL